MFKPHKPLFILLTLVIIYTNNLTKTYLQYGDRERSRDNYQYQSEAWTSAPKFAVD